ELWLILCIYFRIVHICFFFFFSSRRRHTRSKRDWSSDVCSSDLNLKNYIISLNFTFKIFPLAVFGNSSINVIVFGHLKWANLSRSEERRVGKECRSRCATYH